LNTSGVFLELLLRKVLVGWSFNNYLALQGCICAAAIGTLSICLSIFFLPSCCLLDYLQAQMYQMPAHMAVDKCQYDGAHPRIRRALLNLNMKPLCFHAVPSIATCDNVSSAMETLKQRCLQALGGPSNAQQHCPTACSRLVNA
jgi:hypothetical protein